MIQLSGVGMGLAVTTFAGRDAILELISTGPAIKGVPPCESDTGCSYRCWLRAPSRQRSRARRSPPPIPPRGLSPRAIRAAREPNARRPATPVQRRTSPVQFYSYGARPACSAVAADARSGTGLVISAATIERVHPCITD